MNKTSTITVLVVAVLVVAGVVIFGGDSSTQQPAATQDDQVSTTTNSTSTPSDSEATTTSAGGTSTPAATTQDEMQQQTSTSSAQSDQQSSEDTATQSQTVTVTYTADGFSPETLEVAQGDTVRFVNESETDMWVGSDQHPTHTQYSGTSLRDHCPEGSDEAFDQCESGDTYSFTFKQAGSWSYHNHLQASDGGTVVVE